MNIDEKMVSPRDAAQMLGVSIFTIYKWLRAGQLPSFTLPNGYLRIREADIQALLTVTPKRRRVNE